MIDSEKELHKEKIKKVMVDHLTALGYPDIEDDQIMAELKPIWIKLEEAGLIVEDLNFQAYQAYANDAFLKSQIRAVLGI